MATPLDTNLPPNRVALIIDGVVQDVLHCPDRLAAVLLSTPTIIDASEPSFDGVTVGSLYNAETNEFTQA